ncbi:hypothetical protein BMG03_17710 [Thioclava nitratireducens]|uniref:Glycerophosphodiester phosphodiesterase n=1 Tax=Thioclava nitratireducens TaxID=1915078 RepID=A0ABM6IL66_9RHOB|nr:hypothetical protein [Thioclava nitratireducens]AQS49421.1 hypothetical protein BMG03_17710 [Thioclava nitratireducens]
MSRKIRNARIAMLSPLAFALAFAPMQATPDQPRDAAVVLAHRGAAGLAGSLEEVEQLTDWLERHGQA